MPFLQIFGVIAQLVERLHGMQEVGSSTLPGSTIAPQPKWLRGFFLSACQSHAFCAKCMMFSGVFPCKSALPIFTQPHGYLRH